MSRWFFPKFPFSVGDGLLWTCGGDMFLYLNLDYPPENYCNILESFTSWYGKYPIIFKVLYMPGGAGFLPSNRSNGKSPCSIGNTSTQSRVHFPLLCLFTGVYLTFNYSTIVFDPSHCGDGPPKIPRKGALRMSMGQEMPSCIYPGPFILARSDILLVVEIPPFTGFSTSQVIGLGISEPSTVWFEDICLQVLNSAPPQTSKIWTCVLLAGRLPEGLPSIHQAILWVAPNFSAKSMAPT